MNNRKLDDAAGPLAPGAMRVSASALPIRVIIAILCLGLLAAVPAPAVQFASLPVRPAKPGKGASTGLPLPRFVSLVSGDVNMRVGPGFQYPIEWVYKERGLPVVIEREFDNWRLVLAPDGGRGWMHEATLSSTRTFLVSGGERVIRAGPDDKARAVAVVGPGVLGRIRRCKPGSAWCAVEVDHQRGFLRRSDFWGAFPDEAVP